MYKINYSSSFILNYYKLFYFYYKLRFCGFITEYIYIFVWFVYCWRFTHCPPSPNSVCYRVARWEPNDYLRNQNRTWWRHRNSRRSCTKPCNLVQASMIASGRSKDNGSLLSTSGQTTALYGTSNFRRYKVGFVAENLHNGFSIGGRSEQV